jgi:hypothetical protein
MACEQHVFHEICLLKWLQVVGCSNENSILCNIGFRLLATQLPIVSLSIRSTSWCWVSLNSTTIFIRVYFDHSAYLLFEYLYNIAGMQQFYIYRTLLFVWRF